MRFTSSLSLNFKEATKKDSISDKTCSPVITKHETILHKNPLKTTPLKSLTYWVTFRVLSKMPFHWTWHQSYYALLLFTQTFWVIWVNKINLVIDKYVNIKVRLSLIMSLISSVARHQKLFYKTAWVNQNNVHEVQKVLTYCSFEFWSGIIQLRDT